MVTIATVKFISSKRMQTRQGLASILAYCKRDEKTIHKDRKLVSGINQILTNIVKVRLKNNLQRQWRE